MEPHRPRLSVLSLFDPLSGSPNSSLNKENNPADSTFFHPYGLSKARTPVQPTFRCRLIDVGDITLDEANAHDLLAEEEEFEQELNSSLAAGDDDNDTLTFRDMAQAATPKWSGQHYTSLTTPKSSPTPRTPLAEISFKEERTPIARKKPYRHLPTVASKMQHVDCVETPVEERLSSTMTVNKSVSPIVPPLSTSSPRIEISLHKSPQHPSLESLNQSVEALGSSVCTLDLPTTSGPLIADISILLDTPETSSHSAESLGSSVCTLNLPPASGALISDTPIPISILPSSPQTSSTTLSSPIDTQARLRPKVNTNDHLNRYSVDLQSSFQLHLNSTDATFDLLNEKISFFNFKDGSSLLNNMDIDGSFSEDDFGMMKDIFLHGRTAEKVTTVKSTERHPQLAKEHKPIAEGSTNPVEAAFLVSDNPVDVSKKKAVSDHGHGGLFVKRSTSESSSTPNKKDLKSKVVESPRGLSIPVSINTMSSGLSKNAGLLSTPSSSISRQVPPRAVPALKIVKRSKQLVTAQSNPSTNTIHSDSRRSSIVVTAPRPTSKDSPRSPPQLISASNGNKQTDVLPPTRGLRRTVPIQPVQGSLPPGGPRRVLISEGPRLKTGPSIRTNVCLDRTKSSSTTNGPQRIVVASAPSAGQPPPVLPVARLAAHSNTALKQPVKYPTVGSISAIPKPVTSAVRSNLPGSKARFGMPLTGASKS